MCLVTNKLQAEPQHAIASFQAGNAHKPLAHHQQGQAKNMQAIHLQAEELEAVEVQERAVKAENHYPDKKLFFYLNLKTALTNLYLSALSNLSVFLKYFCVKPRLLVPLLEDL